MNTSPRQPKKFYAVSVHGRFDSAERSPEAGRHFKNADYLAADSSLTEDVRKTIISRARYECANNGYADGILQTLADAAIGTGPRLQLFAEGMIFKYLKRFMLFYEGKLG